LNGRHQLPLPVALIAAALIACAALYARGLAGPLIVDDHTQLTRAVSGEGLDYAGCGYLCSGTSLLGRPVAMASFELSARLSGGDFAGWKTFNLALHLANGLLVFWLASLLARSRVTGAVVAAAWVLHPLHVSTVLYTVQRMAELSALFVIAGLACYVVSRRRQIEGRRGGAAGVLATFVVFTPLAMLSKENGALLPLLALLAEWLLLGFRGDARARRLLAGAYVAFLALPGLVGAGFLLARWEALFADRFAMLGFGPWERLLTESRVVVAYLLQLLVPAQRNMGFFHDDVAVSHGLLDPPATLLAVAALAALVALALIARRRAPLFAFGALFFLAAHLVESTVLPLELMFEHRNYLPSVGVLLALAGLWPSRGVSPRVAGAVAACALVALGALTWQRVHTWSSTPRFYNYAAQVHPGSERLMSTLASHLTRARRYRDALALLAPFESAGAAAQRLDIECRRDGRLDAGALAGLAARLEPPVDVYAHRTLAKLARRGLGERCALPPAAFLAVLERALGGAGDPYELWIYKSHYLWRTGAEREALVALDTAARLEPRDPMPLLIAAERLARLGEREAAAGYLARGARVAESSRLDYEEVVEAVRRLVRGDG